MVFDDSSHTTIIRTELGKQTGDVYCQTADGQWWKTWDGVVRTGEEVKQLHYPRITD